MFCHKFSGCPWLSFAVGAGFKRLALIVRLGCICEPRGSPGGPRAARDIPRRRRRDLCYRPLPEVVVERGSDHLRGPRGETEAAPEKPESVDVETKARRCLCELSCSLFQR